MRRPLPSNGETDCPQCGSRKTVARHNAQWTCYKCGFGEIVDDDREAEREAQRKARPNLKLLTDRVLVLETKVPQVSKGGLHIPEIARELRSCQGTVVATGPKVRDICDGVKVLLPEFGGQIITFEGTDYLLFAESELMAVFR